MGTTAEKLTYLQGTKTAIKDAIIAKGVAVPNGSTFREYAGKIEQIPTGTIAGADEYVRPSDWLPLPTVNVSDQKAVGLYAVYEENNYVAFRAIGSDYTVDWGDGIIENFNSNVIAYHEYNFNDLVGSDSILGYRQALVIITAQNDGQFISFDFDLRHNKPGLNTSYQRTWLDIEMASETLTGFNISSLEFLEIFSFIGTNQIVNFNSIFRDLMRLRTILNLWTGNGITFTFMFYDSPRLQYIYPFDISQATDIGSMYYNCRSLKVIPSMSTLNVFAFGFQTVFYNCHSLLEIPIGFDTSNGTSFFKTFYNCKSLESIHPLNTANGTNFQEMFFGCELLEKIPSLNTANGTNVSGLFYGCQSLREIPAGVNTSNATLVHSLFNNCQRLKEVPALDFSKATNMNSQWTNNTLLQKMGAINYSAATTFNGFGNFYRLSKVEAFGFKVNIPFTNCMLSREALVEIFTNLSDQTGQTTKTITVTGNYGVINLTQSDRNIAINKNWTIAS